MSLLSKYFFQNKMIFHLMKVNKFIPLIGLIAVTTTVGFQLSSSITFILYMIFGGLVGSIVGFFAKINNYNTGYFTPIIKLTILSVLLVLFLVILSPYIAEQFDTFNDIRDLLLNIPFIINIIPSMIYGFITYNLAMLIRKAMKKALVIDQIVSDNGNNILTEIRNHIGKDETEQAINKLESFFRRENNEKAINELKVISARYNRLKKENILEITDDKVTLNKINYSLLMLIEEYNK